MIASSMSGLFHQPVFFFFVETRIMSLFEAIHAIFMDVQMFMI